MSKEEIVKQLKTKIEELNELILKGNELNLSVHLLQCTKRSKENKELYSEVAVTIFESVTY